MARPTRHKPKQNKEEGFTRDERLDAVLPSVKVAGAQPHEETYIPLAEMSGVEPDAAPVLANDPLTVDGLDVDNPPPPPNGVDGPDAFQAATRSPLPPMGGTPGHATKSIHTRIQLQDSMFETPEQVLNALSRAREQNSMNDYHGPSEYVWQGGCLRPNNYFNRR